MSKTLIVRLDVKNAETESDLRAAVSSVPGCLIGGSSGSLRCDVLFLEIGYDLDEEFRQIEQIRAKGLAREIFLMSEQKDPDVLLKALKAGVKEFFSQPLNKNEVSEALVHFKRSMPEPPEKIKKGLIVSVIGAKGGVGATTTAVNVAVSLKEIEENKSVVLVDMNPLLGSVHIFLDVKPSFSWVDGARDIDRIDSTYLFHSLHKHSSGIYVLPAPVKPAGLEAATPETMEQLLVLLQSSFDIVVMDACKSFDDLSLKMLALSDTIVLVSELNLLSIINAKKLLETLDGLGISYGKDIKCVINRHQKKSMVSAAEAEKTLERKISGMIANDYDATISAVNTGKTLAEAAPGSATLQGFKALADVLLNRDAGKKKSTSLQSLGNQLSTVAGKLNLLKNFRIGLPAGREAREKR